MPFNAPPVEISARDTFLLYYEIIDADNGNPFIMSSFVLSAIVRDARGRLLLEASGAPHLTLAEPHIIEVRFLMAEVWQRDAERPLQMDVVATDPADGDFVATMIRQPIMVSEA